MVSGPALHKDGGQALDLLIIALKIDSNKPAVDCVFSTITKALKKRDSVTLIGFGTFKVEKRKARKGKPHQWKAWCVKGDTLKKLS